MKGILKNLHRYVFWAIISVVFWAWIFTRITVSSGTEFFSPIRPVSLS